MNEKMCSHQCFPFSKRLLQMQIKVQRIVFRNKCYFTAYLWRTMHTRIFDTGQGPGCFRTQYLKNGSVYIITYKAPTQLLPY
jgi:hypothetical protein